MVQTLTDQEEQLMPDPSKGDLTKKKQLLNLAKEHGILRIAAERGLSVEDAIRFIEVNSARMAEADFPQKHFGLLK